jgi:DNA repair ATPase RecN
VTEVARLSEAERETELAQMIGGSDGGEASRLSARELLDRAGAWCAARFPEPVA